MDPYSDRYPSKGVHSKVYVRYIREFIVSRVHYCEVQLYICIIYMATKTNY